MGARNVPRSVEVEKHNLGDNKGWVGGCVMVSGCCWELPLEASVAEAEAFQKKLASLKS